MSIKIYYHSNRYARVPLKHIWIPRWWMGQVVAPILDKYDNNPTECANYTVTARKP